MLMVSLYLIHPFLNFWKISLIFIYMSFFFMFIPINAFFGINSMNLSCDMLSFMMIFLTIFIFSLCFLSMSSYKDKMLFFYMILLFKVLMMTFSLSNYILFYIFFELSLIPMMIIILGWGMKVERIQAGLYFLFYTMFSSLPLLFCLIYSFFILSSSSMKIEENMVWLIGWESEFLFMFFIVFAFLVKMPIFMFHLWLPKAHVEAPVFGSMILAGILLKLGGYGLIRMMTLIYEVMYNYSSFYIVFSIWGGLMISFSCLNQMDMKVIVALSSVSHMSLLIGGIFSLTKLGLYGSFIMMVSHAFSSSGLFYLVNVVYERSGSRSLIKNKGLINLTPNLSLCSFLIISSSMATPPTLNLLSELILFYAMVFWFKYIMLMMFFVLMMGVVYSMYMYSFLNHGKMYSGMYFFKKISLLEYFVVIVHWVPTNLLVLKSDFFMFY